MNAIIPVNGCSPVAFEDVFEQGDRWEKVQGCEACELERRTRCCGTCKMLLKATGECRLHDAPGKHDQDKPLYCVIVPTPDTNWKGCALVFRCTRGTRIGQIHRVADPANVFLDGVP